MFGSGVRGTLWLPFFLLLQLLWLSPSAAEEQSTALTKAKELRLAQDPTWLALLHFTNNRCYITDKSYYLAEKECSPQDELHQLIVALFSHEQAVIHEAACRFPARIEFIRQRLTSEGLTVPETRCAAFEEFKERAPADVIALVFAAENITSPMSMMGHVFLKFEGKTSAGSEVEHAASFFTNINTLNVPALLLDSLLLGMPSTFALVPYAEQVRNYQVLEGRSIFEYPLKASEQQQRLIHAHVWELRTIDSPYLFVGYNCATVVYFLVALANPSLLDDLGYWIAPIDVVRKAERKGVLASRRFIPSVDWQVRFYGHQLGRSAADSVVQLLQHGSPDDFKQGASTGYTDLHLAFAQALLQREHHALQLAQRDTRELADAITKATSPGVVFEVENLKDPATGPLSSRIAVGATHFRGERYGKIEILPASHSLSDDNRRSNSESMLELGQLSLLFNPEGERPIVEKANIYGLDSLVPHDPYLGGTSSRLIIGVERQWDGSLSPYTAGHVTVGLGKTVSLSEDARIYTLLNTAVNYGDSRTAATYFPEVGGILYEVLSMKTVAHYRLVCGQHGADSCYQAARVTQALLLNDSFSPYAAFDTLWKDTTSTQIFEIGLKFYL